MKLKHVVAALLVASAMTRMATSGDSVKAATVGPEISIVGLSSANPSGDFSFSVATTTTASSPYTGFNIAIRFDANFVQPKSVTGPPGGGWFCSGIRPAVVGGNLATYGCQVIPSVDITATLTLATFTFTACGSGSTTLHLSTLGPPDDGGSITGTYTQASGDFTPQTNSYGADAAVVAGGAGSCSALETPWPAGETWFYTGGPHCDTVVPGSTCPSSSPRYAVDFAPPGSGCKRRREDSAWVVTAAPGVVRAASLSLVEIDHPDGTRTGYYHLRSDSIQVSVGQWVYRGTQLGHPSCEALRGGSANGDHVHFFRCTSPSDPSAVCLSNPALEQPANGQVISGWTVLAQAGNYNGEMVKDAVTKTASIYQCTSSSRGRRCSGITNDILSDNAP